MEVKTEDEVVDIESASSDSFNDDSDDEESLVPEIDDGVHLEVCGEDIFFHLVMSFFMLLKP